MQSDAARHNFHGQMKFTIFILSLIRDSLFISIPLEWTSLIVVPSSHWKAAAYLSRHILIAMVFLQETGRLTLGTSVAMVILATFGLAGRFAARIKADASMKLEDWLIIAGFSTFITYVGVFLHGEFSSRYLRIAKADKSSGVLSSGGTLNISEMSLAQLSHALKVRGHACSGRQCTVELSFQYVYVAESLFTATITFVKLSILSLYRTIFPTPAFRRASLLVGVGCLIWFFVCFFVNMFQCRPLVGAWKPELVFSGNASCIVYGDFIVGYEISNMLLDIIILCLPIWQIRKLQLPTAKKLVIGGVFILGGL